MFTVYMHISPNNKRYIGITSQKPTRRWNNGEGYKKNNYFYNAILKYGWNNIEHKILFSNLNKEEAEEKEIELISKYKSNEKKYGYNIDNGGNCCGTHSQVTKIKISKNRKGKCLNNKNMAGKHHNEETKKKMSEAHKGLKNYLYGKHHSKETIDKIKKSQKCQKIICIETGSIYESSMDIERQTGFDQGNICKCCKGKTQSAYGYHWKYLN